MGLHPTNSQYADHPDNTSPYNPQASSTPPPHQQHLDHAHHTGVAVGAIIGSTAATLMTVIALVAANPSITLHPLRAGAYTGGTTEALTEPSPLAHPAATVGIGGQAAQLTGAVLSANASTKPGVVDTISGDTPHIFND